MQQLTFLSVHFYTFWQMHTVIILFEEHVRVRNRKRVLWGLVGEAGRTMLWRDILVLLRSLDVYLIAVGRKPLESFKWGERQGAGGGFGRGSDVIQFMLENSLCFLSGDGIARNMQGRKQSITRQSNSPGKCLPSLGQEWWPGRWC